MPLAVIELKNPADEEATIWTAFNQLQTYKEQIPSLFALNEALVISDGLEARIGSLTANREWFLPWRTIGGDDFYPPPSLRPSPSGRGSQGEGLGAKLELEVLVRGAFERQRCGTRKL